MALDSQSPSAAGLKASRKGANDGSGLAEWVMLLVRLRHRASGKTEGGRADNSPGSPMYPGLSLIRLEALASVMGGCWGLGLEEEGRIPSWPQGAQSSWQDRPLNKHHDKNSTIVLI